MLAIYVMHLSDACLSLERRSLSFLVCLVGLLSVEVNIRNVKSDQLIHEHCK